MAKIISIHPQNPGFHISYASDAKRMIFGFDGAYFESQVQAERFETGFYKDHNIKTTQVSNSVPSSKQALFEMMDCPTNSQEEGYVFKKYVWDTDDCIEIKKKDLRTSDLLKMMGRFFLVTAVVDEGKMIATVDMGGHPKFFAGIELETDGCVCYRHKSL